MASARFAYVHRSRIIFSVHRCQKFHATLSRLSRLAYASLSLSLDYSRFCIFRLLIRLPRPFNFEIRSNFSENTSKMPI